jgi:hypothetical protein
MHRFPVGEHIFFCLSCFLLALFDSTLESFYLSFLDVFAKWRGRCLCFTKHAYFIALHVSTVYLHLRWEMTRV